MFSVLRHSSANAKPKSEKKFLSDFDKRAASEVTKCFMRLLPHGSVSERTFPVINIPHLFDYLIRQTSVRRRDKHNDFCRVDGEKSRKIFHVTSCFATNSSRKSRKTALYSNVN